MTTSDTYVKSPREKSCLINTLILTVIAVVISGLVLLGNWQLSRLDWKLALIDRIESRVFATPVAAPTMDNWSGISQESDEYRHVYIHGYFQHERETLVWALTEYGNGYWVLTPIKTTTGETVLINRGYVSVENADSVLRSAGQIEGEVLVTGLLRINEPDGIALRKNDPLAEHWYSRDVNAIAQARQLNNVAPYFIDADNSVNPGGLPIGGLTRIEFRNVHFIYAVTWYGMALILAVMTLRVVWLERR
ncbi:MAG: hypothetical protein COA54_13020 [Thiotrichaceae bacterium]|nr:MAG: hypothetical protein COA54_13020 [Thiotrichaceae bacterium]